MRKQFLEFSCFKILPDLFVHVMWLRNAIFVRSKIETKYGGPDRNTKFYIFLLHTRMTKI